MNEQQIKLLCKLAIEKKQSSVYKFREGTVETSGR